MMTQAEQERFLTTRGWRKLGTSSSWNWQFRDLPARYRFRDALDLESSRKAKLIRPSQKLLAKLEAEVPA